MFLALFFTLLSCRATKPAPSNIQRQPVLVTQSAFEDIDLTRIGFGSCYEPIFEDFWASRNQESIWRGVSRFQPQVFLWLGDNVYHDLIMQDGYPKEVYMGANREFIADKSNTSFLILSKDAFPKSYARLRQQESLKSFLSEFPDLRIAATWDDHDFCVNDCFGEGPFSYSGRVSDELKVLSKTYFIDFVKGLNPPSVRNQLETLHPNWGNDKQGIYTTYLFGKGLKKVRIIILDTRFHQNPEMDQLLGEKQWLWLENTLMQNDGAAFTLILSSIQLLPDIHGGPLKRWVGQKFGETWGRSGKANFIEGSTIKKSSIATDFRSERSRLIQLVMQSKRSGVVFLSGDKHLGTFASLSPKQQRERIDPAKNIALPYPLYEITSSGLSHTLASSLHKKQHLAGAEWLYDGQMTIQRHFGAIEFDWQDIHNPSMTISLRTENNALAQSKDWDTLYNPHANLVGSLSLSMIKTWLLFAPRKPMQITLHLDDLRSSASSH